MKISNEELSKRLKESFRPKPTSWELFYKYMKKFVEEIKEKQQQK
ncbi:hypothetical protein ACH34C_07060 [Elizabethkingia anophelis]